MTDPMDRALGAWLREGPEQGPEAGLQQVLSRSRRRRQRPGWSFPERWLPMQLTATRIPSMRPLLYLATLGLLLAAIVAAALLVGSQQRLPEPFGLARNGIVVFERVGDLYTAQEWGSPERPLVTSTAREYLPTFSRQGTDVAFFREAADGADLYLTRVGTDTVTRVAGPFALADDLQWSADGRSILVSYSGAGIPRISVVTIDGGERKDLRVGTPAQLAALRPDGHHIAFRGQPRDGSAPSAVYLVGVDGTGLQRLQLGPPAESVIDFESLTWSPDGGRLAYMSYGWTEGLDWQISIASVDPDGVVIGVDPLHLDPDSRAEMLPVWSPDGTRMSFVLDKDGRRRIALVAGDGSGPVQVVGPDVATDADGVGHAWSPDGRELYVTFLHSAPRPEVDGADQSHWIIDVATGEFERVEGGTFVEIPDRQRLAP
jgi:Tol biopolymer transport system component